MMIILEICPMIPNETTTQHRVYDILIDSGISHADTTLQIVVDGETIADNATVLDLWILRQDWIYTQSKLHHYQNAQTQEEIAGGYIFAEWGNFIARNGENLKRMIDALYAEYNPINNYDMVEQGATGTKQDKHRTTPHGKITNTSSAYQTGVNSTGDGTLTGKTVTETEYTNADSETEYDNTMTIKNNDDVAETGYHRGEQHYLKRSGNIGVTTSAQMISQELQLRVVDLIADFVKRFFDTYCYFVG